MPVYSSAVLLVEGDLIARHRLADYLRDCHFRVLEASNGGEALAFLANPDVRIDLVFANTTAAGSGAALAERIAAEHPSITLIFAGPAGMGARAGTEAPPLAVPYVYHLVLQRLHQAVPQPRVKRVGS